MKLEHGKPRTDGNETGYYFLFRIARRCWVVMFHSSKGPYIAPGRSRAGETYNANSPEHVVTVGGRDLATFRLRRDAEHYLENLDERGQ